MSEAEMDLMGDLLHVWIGIAFKFRTQRRAFIAIMEYLSSKSKDNHEFVSLLNNLVMSIYDGTYDEQHFKNLDEIYEWLKRYAS